MGKSQNEYMNHDERPALSELPLSVAHSTSKLNDLTYYSQLFQNANVRWLLKSTKGSFNEAKTGQVAKMN